MFRNLLKSRTGFSLIEVIVAVALLAMVGIGLLSTLGDATKILFKADVRETARDLAQAQMEYIQSLPYSDSYFSSPKIDSEYPGFHTIPTPAVSQVADGLQNISITVQHESAPTPLFTLQGRKVQP